MANENEEAKIGTFVDGLVDYSEKVTTSTTDEEGNVTTETETVQKTHHDPKNAESVIVKTLDGIKDIPTIKGIIKSLDMTASATKDETFLLYALDILESMDIVEKDDEDEKFPLKWKEGRQPLGEGVPEAVYNWFNASKEEANKPAEPENPDAEGTSL